MGQIRIKASQIQSKIEEQGYRCAYTGDELTPENVAADHIVPVSRGGSHDLDNIRLVTAEVNSAKGTMLFEDFVDLCRRVVAHADARVGGQVAECLG